MLVGMKPTEPWRIAVVSRDGVGVNERFHRASDDFVFEWTAAGLRFVDRRLRPPSKGPVFRDYAGLALQLADCRTIVALAFNGEAKRELERLGFRLHEARGPIDAVIRRLAADSVGPHPTT